MLKQHDKGFYVACSLSLFLALWAGIAWYFRHTPLIFPAPWAVIHRIIIDFSLFGYHASVTFLEMLTGICVATLMSFAMAYAMLKIRLVKALLEPYFVIMQCLPMFTLAPLCIIWFGWSFVAIMIPTAIMISFPLTMSIYQGLSICSQPHVEFFKLHGASERQLLLNIRLPFALPHIFSGLRISAAISGVGAIAGEWAGAQRGLGVLLQISKRNFDLEAVFGSIVCLLILSISFYSAVALLEKKLMKGHFDYIETPS